jgi:tRNA (guanine37-N1)-methyltransferase
MVKCIKALLKDAEKIKTELLEKEQINIDYKPHREKEHIYFPIQNYEGKYEIIEKNLEEHKKRYSAIPFKKALEKILNSEELLIAKTTYEVVGGIAIIEVPEELDHKKIEIAQCLLDSNNQLTTVVKKSSGHEGTFRTQKMTVLAGENTKIASYRENNCTIKYDIENVYFSARLSTERKRIMKLIKEDEEILVMFSGAAPYPCVFSKNTNAKEIVGVEINPMGYEYGLENIKKNKIKNVKLFCGDVRDVIPQLHKKFDRIVMPLPKTAEEFLDVTLPVAKKGCVIHMYAFYHENEFSKATDEIAKYCKVQEREYKILSINKAGQHAPRTYRICVDFKLLN